FDRLVLELAPDEAARQAWSRHLHYREAMPSLPAAIQPLVFSGISDAGSIVEIRRGNGDELGVEIDGALVERVAPAKDLAGPPPRVPLRPPGFPGPVPPAGRGPRRPGGLPGRRRPASVGALRGAVRRRPRRRERRAHTARPPRARPSLELSEALTPASSPAAMTHLRQPSRARRGLQRPDARRRRTRPEARVGLVRGRRL